MDDLEQRQQAERDFVGGIRRSAQVGDAYDLHYDYLEHQAKSQAALDAAAESARRTVAGDNYSSTSGSQDASYAAGEATGNLLVMLISGVFSLLFRNGPGFIVGAFVLVAIGALAGTVLGAVIAVVGLHAERGQPMATLIPGGGAIAGAVICATLAVRAFSRNAWRISGGVFVALIALAVPPVLFDLANVHDWLPLPYEAINGVALALGVASAVAAVLLWRGHQSAKAE